MATIPFANGIPYANGVLSAASGQGSQSDFVIPIRERGFNILLTGSGVGSIFLERSFDDGVTWVGVYAAGTQLYSWSYSGSPISETAEDPESNTYYRLRCTALSSGTINYRIGQR